MKSSCAEEELNISYQYYRDRPTTTTDEEIDRATGYLASRVLTFLPELDSSWEGTLLDDGCGVGKLVFGLQHSLPGAKITGIELTHASVKKAQLFAKRRMIPNVTFLQGSALALPFDDAQYDVVLSEQVVEHVDSPDVLIQEAFRVLKPGGLFFVTTTSRLCPWEFHINFPFIPWFSKTTAQRILRLIGRPKQAAYYEHVFPISSRTLEHLLNEAGFERVAFRGARWFDDAFLAALPDTPSMRMARRLAPAGRVMSRVGIGRFLLKHFFPYTCFVAWKP